jgi:hypothetical protein
MANHPEEKEAQGLAHPSCCPNLVEKGRGDAIGLSACSLGTPWARTPDNGPDRPGFGGRLQAQDRTEEHWAGWLVRISARSIPVGATKSLSA